jgi:predicted transcriptional regulator
MNTREEIKKVIDTLPEEALEGVLDYVRFIQEPEEVEPTEEDIKAIARGKEEIARGEVVRWRDIKKNVL